MTSFNKEKSIYLVQNNRKPYELHNSTVFVQLLLATALHCSKKIVALILMSGSSHILSVLIGVEYLVIFIYFLLFCLGKLNQN